MLIVRNFLETEKKIKHPIRTDHAAGDEVFVRTMGQLLKIFLIEGAVWKEFRTRLRGDRYSQSVGDLFAGDVSVATDKRAAFEVEKLAGLK